MKLEWKLGLSTGTLMIAMLLSALAVQYRMGEANQLSHSLTAQRIPEILAVHEVRSQTGQSVRALEEYLLFHTLTSRGESLNRIASIPQQFARPSLIAAQSESGSDAQKIRLLRQQIAELTPLEEQAAALQEEDTPESTAAAKKLMQEQVVPISASIVALTGEVSDQEADNVNHDIAGLLNANERTLTMVWAVALIGSFIVGIVSWLLARHITRAVELVSERANAIAAGDLTGEALKPSSTHQIDSLGAAMNRMQSSLGTIIGTVAETVGSLTGSAASMRSASDQIHRRIDQQSQQTQQAATAMQEMSASIAEVSRHTHSAAETARSAAQTARDGGTIVKEMLASMHSITEAVTETSEAVGQLGEDSRRISQIVTVIDDIARKTNLLALNAAIEAARAGDQGRGFAVVAGEVRRLAESTAQATGEIGDMIQGIQDRTRSAVASMKSGTGTVEKGVITTGLAGEALEKIIGMAERVDRMITQIAIAASQQASAADQSSASLDSIHTLSQDNLVEMATTAAGIESLRGTAVRLEQQVDRFQVIHAA
jgi:methyl-accepting chemotaxis protein